MKEKIRLKTRSGHCYLYSSKMNRFLLVHPVVKYLADLEKQGIKLDEWLQQREQDRGQVEIKNVGKVTQKELTFYARKYQHLQQSGFFDKPDIKKRISGRINAEDVQISLANLDQLVFEVTDNCNLQCGYCTYGKMYDDYDKRENKFMETGVAKNLLHFLQKFWHSPLHQSTGNTLNIGFYGGEPLLNLPFIKEIIDVAKKMPPPPDHFTFSMTTNGLLLMKAAEFLVENDFRLLVSLDGNEENNGYRVYPNGKPAFHDIIKNIQAFREKYRGFFETNVQFNAVLHNKNSVADIHHFFKETFGKVPMISEVNPFGIAHEHQHDFLKTYKNIYESLKAAENCDTIEKDMYYNLPAYRSASRFVRRYSGWVSRDYRQLLHRRSSSETIYIPTGTCLPFGKKLFLTVNGKILPCERIGHQYSLGWADEQKVDLDFQKIAATYNHYYDKLEEQCSGCCHTGSCPQCLFHTGIEKEHPVCDGFMNYTEFAGFLAGALSYLEKNRALYPKILKEVPID